MARPIELALYSFSAYILRQQQRARRRARTINSTHQKKEKGKKKFATLSRPATRALLAVTPLGFVAFGRA